MANYTKGDKVQIVSAAIIDDVSLTLGDFIMSSFRADARISAGMSGIITAPPGRNKFYNVNFDGTDTYINSAKNWFDETWLLPITNVVVSPPVPQSGTLKFKVGDKVTVADAATISNTPASSWMHYTLYQKRASTGVYPGLTGEIINTEVRNAAHYIKFANNVGNWFHESWLLPPQVASAPQLSVPGTILSVQPMTNALSKPIRWSFGSVPNTENVKRANVTTEFSGFCDACNGHRNHKIGCPPKSPRRKGNQAIEGFMI